MSPENEKRTTSIRPHQPSKNKKLEQKINHYVTRLKMDSPYAFWVDGLWLERLKNSLKELSSGIKQCSRRNRNTLFLAIMHSDLIAVRNILRVEQQVSLPFLNQLPGVTFYDNKLKINNKDVAQEQIRQLFSLI